jgi:hypothetical protein
MALTSAQIAKQTEVLAGVRAAFNAAVVPVAAALNSLPQNDVLAGAIVAWNNIVVVMNAGNTAAIHAALDATAAMVPSDQPIVTSPPWFKPDLSSDAAIQSVFANASRFYGTSPTINKPSVYVNGLLEVPIEAPLNAGPGIGGTGCSWQWWMPQTPAPPNELWAEYDFVIGTDVAAGITEAGVKLPGIAAAWEQSGQWAEGTAYGWFSCRLWHRAPNAQGLCELAGYVYSARQMDLDKLPNAGENRVIPTGKMLTPGVKYKLGQHLKYNTQNADGSWNSDGMLEILCDGVVVFSDKAYKLRGDPRALFQSLFVNIFHGGTSRRASASRITSAASSSTTSRSHGSRRWPSSAVCLCRPGGRDCRSASGPRGYRSRGITAPALAEPTAAWRATARTRRFTGRAQAGTPSAMAPPSMRST